MSDALRRLIEDQPSALLAATAGAVAAGALYIYNSGPRPYPSEVSFDRQSLSLPGTDRARVSALLSQGQDTTDSGAVPALLEWAFEDAKTAYESFLRGVRLAGDSPYLGARTGTDGAFEWLTYNEVRAQTEVLGSGLRAKGCQPKDLIGIFSSNRVEWVLSELSMNTQSIISVPLYDTLGRDALQFILKQTKMEMCFCESNKVNLLLDQVSSDVHLKTIIKMGEVSEEDRVHASEKGVELLSMAEVEALGKDHPHEVCPPTPDDLYTVCYTSGTTGNPKGAMLTHRNLVAACAAAYKVLGLDLLEGSELVHLSYLPLAHSFERVNLVLITQFGARIGFFRGDIKLLMDDILALRPTMFPTVPRLLNRVYDRVMDGVGQSSPVKRLLFHLALRMKRREVEAGVVRNNSFWDRLVFNKIQARLGGRVKVICTGAAPISSEVLMFLRCALGCHVVQGYGQTETTAGASLSLPGDNRGNHVGPPLPCNSIKLVSVPELGYFAEKDEGEVCFRGPNVFVGYLNDKEKTDEAIDGEGWLHSGDIGRWRADGTLTIIDRKKNIFKLAQGEYVAPEKVENIYLQAPLVSQAFLHGVSLESWCVGIIVPDETVLPRWAAEHGISGDMAELCQNDDVRQAVLEQITQLGSEKGLKTFEQAKAIHLYPSPFTVEMNVITPTMKIKRPQMVKFFQEEITAMYAGLKAASRK